MIIDRDFIKSSLFQCGFHAHSRQKHILLVSPDSEVSPAFTPVIMRRRGQFRITGGFGLYAAEFEENWRKTLSREELKVERTLPIMISIENFAELNDVGVFRDLSTENEVEVVSALLFEYCSLMPQSVEALLSDLRTCSILGRKFADYIHHFSDVDDSNIYFRKSATFLHWASVRWPGAGDAMSACLDSRTKLLVAQYHHQI